MKLLDVVLPLRTVLANHTLTADSAAAVGGDVDRYVADWLDRGIGVMHAVNMLFSMRQLSGDTDTWHSLRDAVRNQSQLTVTVAAQAEPKYGTAVKTLYWASLTSSLARLQVLEKGKPVPLIPVWAAIMRTYFVCVSWSYRCYSQVLLREGLKMENATVCIINWWHCYVQCN
jgi:hypothetical protein